MLNVQWAMCALFVTLDTLGTPPRINRAVGEPITSSDVCNIPDQQFHEGWSMLHSDSDYGSVAATRIQVEESVTLRTIRWWGAYEDVFTGLECDTLPADDTFQVNILEDKNGEPGPLQFTIGPGNPVYRIPTGNLIQLFDLHHEYYYHLELPKPITLESGTAYWLSITDTAQDFCAWSWETASPLAGASSHWNPGTSASIFPFPLALCTRDTTDCNENQQDDLTDIASAQSSDCQRNGIPDECENDCNGNSIPDECDILYEISFDCNADEIPDDCQLPLSACMDTNCNGMADWCEAPTSFDCNDNGIYDQCDLDCGEPGGYCDVPGCGTAIDCNRNCVLDICETAPTDWFPEGRCFDEDCRPDSNQNGIPDECEDGCLTDHADGDIDCDADIRDYLLMQSCFTDVAGPTYPAAYQSKGRSPGSCDCFDQDFDGDIDRDDWLALRERFELDEAICDYCPDVWSTAIGQAVSYYDFATTPIPAGFFGDNSESFAGIMELVGIRADVPDPAYFDAPEQWDTRIIHPQPEFEQDLFPCHQYATVPIRPDGLRLSGKRPLLIASTPECDDCNENNCIDTEETGANCTESNCGCAVDINDDGVPDECQSWMTDVSLSFATPEPGRMFARTTHFNGGLFSTDFELMPRFTFYLLHDLQAEKPINEVKTVTLDTGLLDLPGLSMSFDDLPWSRNLESSSGLFALDCARGNFIPGIDTEQLPIGSSEQTSTEGSSVEFAGGSEDPDTTCTSHINPGEEHHFCPGDCEPGPSCHYIGGSLQSVPPGACNCATVAHRLPVNLWREPCKDGGDCLEVIAPLTATCYFIYYCRRIYRLSPFDPCSHPPHCP
ncbi:MAG: hypothetical protein ACPGXK_06310 [Phycisphaerae bacterium]